MRARAGSAGSLASGAFLLASAVLLLGAADGGWLRRVPAADRARSNPLAGQAQTAAAGARLYASACSRCHGAQAEGRGDRPPLVSRRVAAASDGELAWLLKNGDPWHGMPNWSALPENERWQLVAYLRQINQTPNPVDDTAANGHKGETK